MHKQEFTFDGVDITSLVMSGLEFSEMCDFLKKELVPKYEKTDKKFTAEDVDRIHEAQHLPACNRGELTEPLFKKYDIQTGALTVCVRVYARKYFGLGDEALKDDQTPIIFEKQIQDNYDKKWEALPDSSKSIIKDWVPQMLKESGEPIDDQLEIITKTIRALWNNIIDLKYPVPNSYRMSLIEQATQSATETWMNCVMQLPDRREAILFYREYLRRLFVSIAEVIYLGSLKAKHDLGNRKRG